MKRRDLLIGAGCVAALGGAEALRPRTLFTLLGGKALSPLIPTSFAGWSVEGGGDIVLPKTPGGLAASLYGETVARNYRHADGGPAIMLLAAHGDSQSDLLQLHRPESCYQAVGFSIEQRRFDPVPLGRGVALPSVELVARSGSRVEDILYWTRLGEYLPVTAGEQRRDRLKTAMDGFVADGVLVRASSIRDPGGPEGFARLAGFVAAMLTAVPAGKRAALIGTQRARALA